MSPPERFFAGRTFFGPFFAKDAYVGSADFQHWRSDGVPLPVGTSMICLSSEVRFALIMENRMRGGARIEVAPNKAYAIGLNSEA